MSGIGAPRGWWLRAGLALLAMMVASGCTASPVQEMPSGLGLEGSAAQGAERFYVVDCLLPAQIRRLGRTAAFLGPRRAIKTTAGECAIRGGEYVAYDRADYRTALRVWLPAAEAGDRVAETYVGEIYEKGLGTAPDHRQAAAWYRKAAEQGHAPAQVNLGHLYELGLGVERDPATALVWYRRAAGLVDGIAIDPVGLSPSLREELRTLREEVKRRGDESETRRVHLEQAVRDLAQARTDLARRSEETQAERQRLEATRRELAAVAQQAARNDVQVRTLERELGEREADLEGHRRTTAALHERVAALGLEAEHGEDAARQLAQARTDLARRSEEAQAERQRLETTRRELAALAQQAVRDDARVRTLERELSERETDLERSRQDAARLRERVAVLETEAERQRRPLAVVPMDGTSMAGPTIEVIEPALVAVRGISVTRVSLDAGPVDRVVVGRVTAPAGLMVLTVNDQEQAVDASGLFRTRVSVTPPDAMVRVVAIDHQGKRESVEFRVGAGEAPPSTARATRVPAAVRPRGYYALIIGNREYAQWPKLQTPETDARRTAELLETRYGFKTHVLINARRADILHALNELRSRLTEKDDLLVYYAGHGYLDEKINRAYWIPVEGDLGSNVEWISTVAITDLVASMSARHVLLVVDSCYSGALTRSALARLEAGMSEEARTHWLEVVASKRSRTVLSSGDLRPVLDVGGGSHSVFARAWLDVLGQNQEVLEGQRLYREIAARVAYAADALRFEQVPQYAPIQFAGHEAGDFLFVPAGE